MTIDHQKNWLSAHFAFLSNPRRFRQLLEHVESIEAVQQASTTQLQQLGVSAKQCHRLKNPPQKQIDDALAWQASSTAHHIITQADPHYPSLLKQITDPPILLFAIGNLTTLSKPSIAIVGSRKPSLNACNLATHFTKQLINKGICITSGLALGIDGASHQACVDEGKATIAVLGSGFNHIYPRQHRALATQVGELGLLLSEYPLAEKPLAAHFPRRNRIISGLSHACFVVEAHLKSGSLITAKLALEQSRNVLTLPWPIYHLPGLGCNQLLQQGAKCVLTVEDILEELPNYRETSERSRPISYPEQQKTNLDQGDKLLLECMACDTVSVDDLANQTQMTIANLLFRLTNLEVHGLICRTSNGYQRVIS